MTQAAAIAIVVLMAGLAVFQLALVAGVPLGRFAWGGYHERLPTPMRIGSLVGIALYAAISLVVLQVAGLIDVLPHGPWLPIAAWAIAAFFAVSIVLNAMSRSRRERFTMTPLVALLCLLSVAVAAAV